MARFRADISHENADGSVTWYARWMGGDTLAKVSNCRIFGTDIRLTAHITGHPDTWFSSPAATRHRGRYVKGYLTTDEHGPIFHPMDSHKHLFANKAEG